MKTDKDPGLTAAELRRRAEASLRAQMAAVPLLRTEEETQRLVHELEVHQIELEMQNAEILQARDEVEAALERYTDLYDFAPVGYFTIDRDGEIKAVNLSGAGLLGIERSRLIGRRFGLFVAAEDRPHFNDFLGKVFANQAKVACEVALVMAEDSRRNVQIEGAAAASGEECHIALMDITELHRARQEMLKSQKLESIGMLAGGIAHDFNNILTAILGNISLARVQVHDPEKVVQRLEDAENAAMRAKDLTQQLLTFARGGAPVKKVITLNSLLTEAVLLAIRGSAVEYEIVLSDDLFPVNADERQLRQVIHNLVLNAVQAMPDKGKITIVAQNGESLTEGEKTVHISVADTGTGIPDNLLQRIFEPYFTTKDQGSGLGLATCYSIIKKHGGNIKVESSGQGTTFHIFLPVSNLEEEALPVANHEALRDCGRGRILVMDDEEMLREIVTAMLEEFGYHVECTENGTAAVNLYRQRRSEGIPFAAVIMDLTIPGGVGGKEAIASLLQFDPNVKAIASSGYSADPVMSNYREYGFSAVLGKPYRLQEMKQVLHELLDTTPIDS